MKIPSVEEVQAYCTLRKNGIDAGAFWDYYESKGWVVGRSKMVNWQAAVRTWERNTKSTSNGKPDITELF